MKNMFLRYNCSVILSDIYTENIKCDVNIYTYTSEQYSSIGYAVTQPFVHIFIQLLLNIQYIWNVETNKINVPVAVKKC